MLLTKTVAQADLPAQTGQAWSKRAKRVRERGRAKRQGARWEGR